MILDNHLLIGERVRLSAMTAADASAVARWQHEPDYTRNLSAQPAYPRNEQQVNEWIREGQRGKENFLFGIRLLADDQLIGFFELDGLLWNNRSGWMSIGIGERDFWDKGYGQEASTLGLDFAFRELNLHRVQLTVFSYNERAIALYDKLGFTREGLHREAILRDGRWYDMILYGLLEHEWSSEAQAAYKASLQLFGHGSSSGR